MGVHAWFWIVVLSGFMPRGGIAGCHGSSIFSFLRMGVTFPTVSSSMSYALFFCCCCCCFCFVLFFMYSVCFFFFIVSGGWINLAPGSPFWLEVPCSLLRNFVSLRHGWELSVPFFPFIFAFGIRMLIISLRDVRSDLFLSFLSSVARLVLFSFTRLLEFSKGNVGWTNRNAVFVGKDPEGAQKTLTNI